MSPTRPTLWLFRCIVLAGIAAIIYFSRTGASYVLWASVVALVLGIFAVQSSGQVALRKKGVVGLDSLSRAMNGPNGLRIRIGLIILFIVLALLGFGLLKPGTLSQLPLAVRDAA